MNQRLLFGFALHESGKHVEIAASRRIPVDRDLSVFHAQSFDEPVFAGERFVMVAECEEDDALETGISNRLELCFGRLTGTRQCARVFPVIDDVPYAGGVRNSRAR